MIDVGMLLMFDKDGLMVILFRLSNPNIRQWMVDNNILSTKSLHKYYADRILDIARNISVTPIVWQDVWDENVEVKILSFSQSLTSLSVTTRYDYSSMERFK
jgi:hypothetical protein